MGDLEVLDSCRAVWRIPPELDTPVSTSLRIGEWRSRLSSHPDQRLANYLVQGISQGFRVGFLPNSLLSPAKSNIPSARVYPRVVAAYIEEEVAKGRMLGPFPKNSVPGLHCSRIGVIPKSQPGKWRMITDLSSPEGKSVNDGIGREWCSLEYVTVEGVSRQVMELGRGALIVKADIRSAYRLVPIHPMDRLLLGVQWEDQLYMDCQLPFGLRSAPKIFTAVADAIEWFIRKRGVRFIEHYLDDYIVFGPPGSSVCARSLETLLDECRAVGAPTADEKTEGPTTVMTFLGIEIDTEEACLRLPPAKLEKLRQETATWARRKTCRKKELESLVGVLQFACKVVRPGRSFLRRMIALLPTVKSNYHYIKLNKEFRSDLEWWRVFAAEWNGVSLIEDGSVPVQIATDASGSWGAGGWSGKQWFQLKWPAGLDRELIAVKELIPLAVALVVWGKAWRGRRVLCHCDNTAAVAAIRSRYSRHPVMAAILRCVFFFEAKFDCSLSATHVAGVLKVRADDLSRNRADRFLSKVAEADPTPTPVPPELLRLLTHATASWTSPHWIQQFKRCLSTV